MAIESRKNQYLGINAHLHSFWQATGLWNRFHNAHIVHLMMRLKAQLLPMGYTAEIEESLQIRRLGDDPRKPRADILISDLRARRLPSAEPLAAHPQTLTVGQLLTEDEDEEHPYSAIGIYEYPATPHSGEPVAWLELLSPSNKGYSADAYVYRAKRNTLLESGLVFVELDFLHETPPTFWRLADYTAHEANSHPYRIIVLDPRPDVKTGPAQVYEFDVDTPIPSATLPLNYGNRLDFDFNAVYHKHFEEALLGYGCDYSELPMNFDRYSPADQVRILTRMLTVLQAAQENRDLEQAPLPLVNAPASVAEGLEALKTF